MKTDGLGPGQGVHRNESVEVAALKSLRYPSAARTQGALGGIGEYGGNGRS